jgi:hypothetical protein
MTNTNESLERQIVALVAADRFGIPIKSMAGKIDRMKPKLAEALDLPKGRYAGERVFARVEFEDKLKSRTISQAVAAYCEKYSAEGKILTQMIEDERAVRETHLYFGINPGCRLTADDYLGVMSNMGFTETQARTLYSPLIETSRTIAKKRDEERRVMLD